jgi:hypothetical protein
MKGLPTQWECTSTFHYGHKYKEPPIIIEQISSPSRVRVHQMLKKRAKTTGEFVPAIEDLQMVMVRELPSQYVMLKKDVVAALAHNKALEIFRVNSMEDLKELEEIFSRGWVGYQVWTLQNLIRIYKRVFGTEIAIKWRDKNGKYHITVRREE